LIIILIVSLVFPVFTGKNRNNKSVSAEPVFRNDGSLTFFKLPDNRIVKSIAIELADEESERQQGLMYRSSMKNDNGMLFVFNEMEDRAFWMKNTKIPLDIIYVSDQRRIVSISENTIPFSLESIPSSGPARYVVEVNAGFTAEFGINAGDSISFKLN
jgi:uncharacterized membrane protein (UPF0127 family)